MQMKIEKLTDDHRLLMAQVKEDWLSRYCSGEPINKDLAREGIEWLYTFSGKRKAPRVIFVDSPLMAQKAANYIEALLVKLKARKGLANEIRAEVMDEVWDEVRDEVWDEVRDEVGDEVRDEVGAEVMDEVWDEVGAEIRAEVGDEVRDEVRAEVWDEVRDEVRDEVGAEVMDEVWDEVRAEVGDEVGAEIRAEVMDEVWDEVRAEVRAEVMDEVWDEVRDEVWAEVGDEVWDEVMDEVWDEVRAEVWDEVRAEVMDEVGDEVRAQKLKKYYRFAWYGSLDDYGWVSFYDFFDQIGLLDGRPEARDKFRTFRDKVLRANIYDMIQLNRFCIVISLPKYVRRDQARRVHSLEGHAIEFNDGYGINRIHGVKFDKELFTRFTKGEVTAIEIITHKNQDQKRAMAMAYGNEKLVNELKAQVVSEEVDKLGNTMRILVVKDSEEDLVFYEAIDPSKDEKVYLRIPPMFANKTAKEAKVWTFPVMWEEYEKTGKLPEFTVET